MTDVPARPKGMSAEFFAACLAVIAKRPRTVIHHILVHGFITTEDLNERYGYDHPPRAVRDVRDSGIPLETFRAKSRKTGRMIAAYRFADPAQMVAGRIGGRRAFSKRFKAVLLAHYGARSTLTNEALDPRYLQIDHRIPYHIAGNDADDNPDHYMLLDASAQRAKSWSCENCENFRGHRNPAVCRECYWAYPEAYTHIATREHRRLDVTWTGDEVRHFKILAADAAANCLSVQDLVKRLVKDYSLRRD